MSFSQITKTVLAVFIATVVASNVSAEIVRDTIDSKMIAGNLLSDDPDREVLVYLPPQYKNSVQRYPVIYLLHSYGSGPDSWLGKNGYEGMNLEEELDRQILHGLIDPVMVVMPDAKTKLGGSWYTDSPSSGKWESFIAEELVEFIDSKYRTRAKREYRGIAGQSMGGYGALRIAMHHPEVFGAVLGMSAVNLVDPNPFGEAGAKAVFESEAVPTSKDAGLIVRLLYSKAVAFSPNPDGFLFADFPYLKTGETFPRQKIIWEKWLEQTLTRRVEEHVRNLNRLKLRLEVGTRDPAIKEMQAFADELNRNEVPFTFLTFEGGHVEGVRKRFEGPVFEFFKSFFRSTVLLDSGVEGRVTDPTGALIPGAEVVFRKRGSQEIYSTTANAVGKYYFQVPNGVYDIEAHSPGFKKRVRKKFEVKGRGVSIVDFMLEVGPPSH